MRVLINILSFVMISSLNGTKLALNLQMISIVSSDLKKKKQVGHCFTWLADHETIVLL